ncbi:40S ribosomal protein S7 [Coprinopsis sp. MPI-PUGE-AT-0042]|nr:40S ribosomal protein S7 [Coprinopsis sp. MPI-PUGE-AT-0042]
MSAPIGPRELTQEEINAKIASFDDVPLFMKSLPEDDAGNATIAALQDLAYEGTPDEIAANFKDQGNDYFKGKRYREALGFYTQGLDAKPSDVKITTALLCNRAACNLELQNYGSVLKDTSAALKLEPALSKAYHRSGQALLALDRVDEALDVCDRCLAFDTTNDGIRTLRDKIVARKELKEKVERDREERKKREQLAKHVMNLAFRERNLINVPKPDGSANPYEPHWDTEDASTLILPVFFLYPQYATSDVIPEFAEDTTFLAHLERMFPPLGGAPEWDARGEYTTDQLMVYAFTKGKRLFKVGKKMKLRDVYKMGKGDGFEVKDGCLTFVVVPKGDAEKKWVDEFKNTERNTTPVRSTKTQRSSSGEQVKMQAWRAGWADFGSDDMSVNSKIQRTANAPQTQPDEIETQVAQALLDLENNVPELKSELRVLQISAAREVDVRGGKKAIVIFVPVPQLKAFHKVQQRLTRELEKKFSDRHVVFVAQRRMLRKPTRTSRVVQKRPRSRTLTSVHEKILEDLVFPTEIVGKRTRISVDGSKLLKVFLDSKDATSLEYKLDSFSSVYRRLTGKEVVFEFPVVSHGDKA